MQIFFTISRVLWNAYPYRLTPKGLLLLFSNLIDTLYYVESLNIKIAAIEEYSVKGHVAIYI